MTPYVHFKLVPGDAVKIEASSLGFGAGKFNHPVGAIIHAEAGQTCRLKFRVSFPGVQVSDGQGKLLVPGRGEWIGQLETGEVEFRVVGE